MKEKIEKLLKSSIADDILLAVELMFEHLSIEDIRTLVEPMVEEYMPSIRRGIAFRISGYESVCYNNSGMWVSSIAWEEEIYSPQIQTHLGNHKDYKP